VRPPGETSDLKAAKRPLTAAALRILDAQPGLVPACETGSELPIFSDEQAPQSAICARFSQHGANQSSARTAACTINQKSPSREGELTLMRQGKTVAQLALG